MNTFNIKYCISEIKSFGSPNSTRSQSAKVANLADAELAALLAENEKYKTALENIVNGNYDNAHEINAARAYAAKELKK